MSQYLLGIMAVAVLVAAALAPPRRRQASGRDRPWPLEATPTILSEPAQVLYRRLAEALPDEHGCYRRSGQWPRRESFEFQYSKYFS